MAKVSVRGATLAAMAASARLARLGHEVTLVTDGLPLDRALDDASPVIALPATWKDLFKKSGGHLQAELNRAGLDLVEAPPPRHVLADGTVLDLPTERGPQFRAVRDALGEQVAQAWRDRLDDLDRLWHAFRRHALEGNEPVVTDEQRRALWLESSVADVAAPLGPLADLALRLVDDPASPALLALPLVVERSFGRWHLVDGDATVQPASRLLGLLLDRMQERGVTLADGAEGEADIDCRQPTPLAQPVSAEQWLALPPIVGEDGALRASAASPAGPEPWAQLGSAALAVYELHERLTGEDCRPTNIAFTMPRLP